MSTKLPDDENVVADETDRQAARQALARNWPNLEEASPKYATMLEALAALHKRCGADNFELQYTLRPPKNREEEWAKQFMGGQITKAEYAARVKADAERPIDLEMLTMFCDAYQNNLAHYSGILRSAVLTPKQAAASVWPEKEKAIDDHMAALRGKLPLYGENLKTVFAFLEEQRITSGAGLLKLGQFEATSAHWLAQLVFTRVAEVWQVCKDVSQRSHADGRYMYEVEAISLFSQRVDAFPVPQSLRERLQEEFILARAALNRTATGAANPATVPQSPAKAFQSPVADAMLLNGQLADKAAARTVMYNIFHSTIEQLSNDGLNLKSNSDTANINRSKIGQVMDSGVNLQVNSQPIPKKTWLDYLCSWWTIIGAIASCLALWAYECKEWHWWFFGLK